MIQYYEFSSFTAIVLSVQSSGAEQIRRMMKSGNDIVSKLCKTKNVCQIEALKRTFSSGSSKIFLLNIDCFEELFDYLSLKELHRLAQTCRRMQRIVGVYFKANFSALDLRCKHDGFYLDCCRNGCKVRGVDEYIQKLSIRTFGVSDVIFENGYKMFRYAGANCNEFLKKIQFCFVQLTGRDLDCIKGILRNVETVVIEFCRMNRKFYENLPLTVGKNLKRLYVSNFECNRNVLRRTGNEWLLQNWPKLEHLGWTQSANDYRINELKTFFDLNPNIHSFSTNFDCLWASRHLIIESNAKLNELTVEIFDWEQPIGQRINDFFNELHARGFYKRLHLHSSFYNEQHQNLMEIGSIHGLEALRHLSLVDGMDFPHLEQLKELRTSFKSYSPNVDALTKKIPNLERLHMRFASIEYLLPFIHHSAKLKEVKIDAVRDEEESKCILDLMTLNNERQKLPNARKVTIYMSEKVYLATKWANHTIDLNLIQIKRAHSHEWSNLFEYY